MATYLTPADFKTHIYAEILNEIIRGDDALAAEAITSAISEAQSYLGRYDIALLFNPDATGYVADRNLSNKVKDLAIWQLLKLSNPSIDLALFRTAYEDAISWLEKVAAGKIAPHGWPFYDPSGDTPPPNGDSISYSSNPKRHNHF